MKKLIITLFLIIPTITNATLRIVPRSDYGKGSSKLEKVINPIKDRIEAITRFGNPLKLGGKYDLLVDYSENQEYSLYKCPTLKPCYENGTSCLMEGKYWQCQKIFKADQKELCRYYKNGARVFKATTFVTKEILTEMILSPIYILEEGAIGILMDINEYAEYFETLKDLIKTSCLDDSPSKLMDLSKSSEIVILSEKEKEEVSDLIKIFDTKNYVQQSVQGMPNTSSSTIYKGSPVEFFDPTTRNATN